jgi:hypothetical protein
VQRRKRSHIVSYPSDQSATPPGNFAVKQAPELPSFGSQEEEQFIHKYLKLADIAIGVPTKQKAKRIA